MTVYRAKYRDRKGKVKRCKHWHLTFNDRAGVRRRMQAYTNKDESENLGRDIDKVMANNGKLKDDNAKSWFANLLPRIQNKLVEYSIVDERTTANHLGTSLSEHLKVFCEGLAADNRKSGYIKQVRTSVSRILSGCGFRVWSDIDGNKVKTFLAKGRGDNGYGQRTYNAHLRSFKIFSKWLSEERKLSPDPMNGHKLIKQTEYRKKRRALTLNEQRKLLEAAKSGVTHHNMTGYERNLAYLLALQSGLRADEIRHLTVSSFDFNGRTVTVQASYTKNKHLAVLDLKKETAAELKTLLTGKMPHTRVFAMPNQPAKMIKRDLKAAGIPYKTDEGQADFHSLRHSFITNLARAGVHPKDAQALARHSSITLTMDCYTHTIRESLRKIIDQQPDLTTGTGEADLSVA